MVQMMVRQQYHFLSFSQQTILREVEQLGPLQLAPLQHDSVLVGQNPVHLGVPSPPHTLPLLAFELTCIANLQDTESQLLVSEHHVPKHHQQYHILSHFQWSEVFDMTALMSS
jgi:hypothetical protein